MLGDTFARMRHAGDYPDGLSGSSGRCTLDLRTQYEMG